jgi:hypothetical protein
MAKVYKCGAEKDPDLVSNMMQVADVSTPVVNFHFCIKFHILKKIFLQKLSPLSTDQAVCPEYTCEVDVSEANKLTPNVMFNKRSFIGQKNAAL